jgi:hypothetical protein
VLEKLLHDDSRLAANLPANNRDKAKNRKLCFVANHSQ